MLNFPGGPKAEPSDVTGSVHGAPKDEALKKFKKAYPSAASMGTGFAAYGADVPIFAPST